MAILSQTWEDYKPKITSQKSKSMAKKKSGEEKGTSHLSGEYTQLISSLKAA
jgi:hypothetical protein